MASKYELLRTIPAVHEIVTELQRMKGNISERLFTTVTRDVITYFRQKILNGEINSITKEEVLTEALQSLEEKLRPSLRRIVNATGVVIHTNLGRSLLPKEAMEAIIDVAIRYSNLELDLATGKRGSRYTHVEGLLCELTGAEGALVVNNNAAAVFLTLNTLAHGREVIVSRGELIEIGGSFRIPDVMARSGAILREVGTTNRTHLQDYEAAINENTALLMKVHKSNFAIVGFTKEVFSKELVELGHKYGLPVIEDLGSGCLVDLSKYGLIKESTVQEILDMGIDIVTFSGDKLLGAPQAGIILGRRKFIEKIKKNPINRAVRIDKLTLAGLEATLRLYRDPDEAIKCIPTLSLITMSPKKIYKRAKRLFTRLKKEDLPGLKFEIKETISQIGGGALPLASPKSYAVVLWSEDYSPTRLERLLREGDLPIISRIEEDKVFLDMRTVLPDEIPIIVNCLRRIFVR